MACLLINPADSSRSLFVLGDPMRTAFDPAGGGTPIVRLPAPANPTAEVVGANVNLSWDTVVSAVSYEYRRLPGGAWTANADTTVTITPGDGTYTFRARAVDNLGVKGVASVASSSFTVDTTAPTLVSATITAGDPDTLMVVWSEVVNGHTGITLAGEHGSIVPTYATGDGTNTYTFSLSRSAYLAEDITLDYTAGNIEDAAGNALTAISDGVVSNLSAEPVPEVAGVVFDVAATFSDGADGDLMTAAKWNNGVVGATWGKQWAEYKSGDPGSNTFTYLKDFALELPFDIVADGTPVARDAVRGWRFDFTGNPDTFDQWTLPLGAGATPGVTELVVCYFFNINTVLNGENYFNDLWIFQATDFFVPQLRHVDDDSIGYHTMTAHADGGTSDTIIVSGGVWHCLVGKYPDGIFRVYECGIVSGALQLSRFCGEATITLAASDELAYVAHMSYLPAVGQAPSGYTDVIGPFLEKTNGTFPPENFPAPVLVEEPDPDTLGVPILLRLESTSFSGSSQDDPVSTWADISGNGNHFTGTGSTRPTVQLGAFGSLPGVKFDAVDDFLTSSLDVSLPYTIVLVEHTTSAESKRTVSSPDGNRLISLGRGGFCMFHGGVISATSFADTTCVGALIAGATGNFIGRVDGRDLTTSAVAVADWQTISLGADNPFSEPADSIVGALFVFDGALNTAQIKSVERWVRNKYGVVIYH